MGSIPVSYPSETSTVRAKVLEFIGPEMNGLDLGAGGDPIMLTSIAMDLPKAYAHTHDEYGLSHPHQLRGDARDLYWFKDGALDYIYSSHLLEDYADTSVVLREWLRVLKPGGLLVLCLPDEVKYRTHCKDTGQGYNHSHKCAHMGREWMEKLLIGMKCSIAASEDVGPYSFYVVAIK